MARQELQSGHSDESDGHSHVSDSEPSTSSGSATSVHTARKKSASRASSIKVQTTRDTTLDPSDADDPKKSSQVIARRSQRASAASASRNLRLPKTQLSESDSEDEHTVQKSDTRAKSKAMRAASTTWPNKKRKRAASPSENEEDSGSGDDFAPDHAEEEQHSPETSDAAAASASSDEDQAPKRASLPRVQDSTDSQSDDDDVPLASTKNRKQPKKTTAAQRKKNPPKASTSMSEDEDMLDLDGAAVDASDLDKLLVSLSSVQAKGAKRPKYTEEDRRRMASEEPDETPAQVKERKAREKAYRKERGAKWNYADKVQLKLEKHHPELLNVWENLRKEVGVITPKKAPQPAHIAMKLLPFQLEGLDWMQRQEAGPWRGGMLADEMGMGKTIQTISLICSDYDATIPMKERKKTLVIAPTVAIVQWRNEFSKFTSGFKVDVWHGQSRTTDLKKLEGIDVILTSYAVLESIYRRQEKGFVKNKENHKEKSVLHAIKFHRVILDEAHNIKDRACNTAKACFALRAKYRWCLSGTPLQNRVGELYSLIRFLGVLPFAANFCTKCSCRSLHWKFSNKKHCDDCGHTPMQHSWYWNNQILKPIQKYGHSGDGADAFKKLHTLLERMMLRRTKVERADDLSLPPRTITVRRDYFTEEEEELYTSLYSDVQRKFSTYIESGTVLNNYGNIFTLITRMRQMACHPDLVLKSKTAKHKILDASEADFSINTCRICLDEAEDGIMSKCRHIFCRACIAEVVEGCGTENMPECPTCHARLVINLEAPSIDGEAPTAQGPQQGMLDRIDPRKWKTSTKIVGLMEELIKLRQEDHTSKALVFSTSTSFLDLIARQLQLGGFKFARLQGTMSPEQRDRTVKYFMNHVDVQVFLLSLKAGGVALNLTEASHVFLVDPWWNPSAEVQAMDRIHRIGQVRPVRVTRLIIENSIESRILELQKKKESMVNAAFGDDEALGRLTPEDLRFLFTL